MKKVAKKVKTKLLKQQTIAIESKKRILRDVLFINGCDPKVCPHPYRYRVLHQIEQLNAANLTSTDVFYIGLNPEIVMDYRVIIFYRCPYTTEIGKAIKLAKSLNKIVLFDVDDLVIDTKYTDLIPYVKGLSLAEKNIYDDGVTRMGKTLCLCDGAITTTEALAEELKHYVSYTFINRNCASEEMFLLSEEALRKKHDDAENIKIGYFSGSITHNADFELVKPALKKILKEFPNVSLLLLGELDLPEDLQSYSQQIEKTAFVDWKRLPSLIASVDINIAPLESTIFNEAKSENKWVEAALVKVPTVASNLGAFRHCINNNTDGLLCSFEDEWYKALRHLIMNPSERKRISENAYKRCKITYNTLTNGNSLAKFLNDKMHKHIGFVLPAVNISGGIMVALTHAAYLQDEGYDVDILASNVTVKSLSFRNHNFTVSCYENDLNISKYDILVATMWSTVDFVLSYPRCKKKLYLVQNYETGFYEYKNPLRSYAERTYFENSEMEYITISKWCEKWLREKYGQLTRFAPNGIQIENFIPHKRNLTRKVRILIEGDNAVDYKNVDESFRIVEKLVKTKFEVWYLSYNAAPKSWYHVDRFLSKVPYEKVGQVYEQCDILIKSSWLESFSYPPLEMMATGGFCVVVPNGGNVEYLKDNVNCLFYPLGEIDIALNKINELLSNLELQDRLYNNGLITAKERDWKNCKESILKLYE